MKNQIITLLRERGDYVSGQELCELFGVSRTAVWKAIDQLKKEGYEIDAVRNRGYLLTDGGREVFSKQEIAARLHTTWVGKELEFYKAIGSTNAEVKLRAENGAAEGYLVVADEQTAGRGRRGRGWVSPPGINVYFSLLLRPDFAPDKAPTITLLMAMAVVKGLEEFQREMGILRSEQEEGVIDTLRLESVDKQESGKIRREMGAEKPETELLQPCIKWPNDVVMGGKKICGILTEMSLEQDYIQNAVIGTGINVKKQEFSEELREKATSIEEVWGIPVSRAALLAHICEAFEQYYEIFLQTLDLRNLKDEYHRMLVNLDRQVCVLDPKGEWTGIARGINDGGELLVEKADGTVTAVYAGEVSVRGIYGYV